MIKKITALFILQSIVITSYSQINSALLNKSQKKVYSESLTTKSVIGSITYRYPSKEKMVKNESTYYTIVFIDSIGNTQKTIGYDENKKRTNYSIYKYDELNQLSKKYNYKADNSILGIDEYLYDISEELIESVQIGKSGTINSKTLNYYTHDGYLNKSEVIGPDGKLTFTSSININRKGLPTDVQLKHISGFTMSTDRIKYNENGLVSETVMTTGMTGKTSKFIYKYNDYNLLIEQKSFNENKLKSIRITKYFSDDFLEFLNENEFEYENLSAISSDISKNEYYFKSLAQYSGGEKALKRYLEENIQTENRTKDKGVVIAGFTVDMDGSIMDIKIHRGVSKKSNKKAIKIIKGMPNWIPAEKSDGSLYKSTVSLSIPFLWYPGEKKVTNTMYRALGEFVVYQKLYLFRKYTPL